MPKIKLSALATDIKGKSGGSVFSTNQGGTYFRNNPSGGGRKSGKWDKAKSKFGSIASSWKSLTSAQIDAWNSAVNNFPTTNAFGDQRFPTGYELYMRLNTPLINIGRPLLQLPPEPAVLPILPDFDLVQPKMDQYAPNSGYQVLNPVLFASDEDCTCQGCPGCECEEDAECKDWEDMCIDNVCTYTGSGVVAPTIDYDLNGNGSIIHFRGFLNRDLVTNNSNSRIFPLISSYAGGQVKDCETNSDCGEGQVCIGGNDADYGYCANVADAGFNAVNLEISKDQNRARLIFKNVTSIGIKSTSSNWFPLPNNREVNITFAVNDVAKWNRSWNNESFDNANLVSDIEWDVDRDAYEATLAGDQLNTFSENDTIVCVCKDSGSTYVGEVEESVLFDENTTVVFQCDGMKFKDELSNEMYIVNPDGGNLGSESLTLDTIIADSVLYVNGNTVSVRGLNDVLVSDGLGFKKLLLGADQRRNVFPGIIGDFRFSSVGVQLPNVVLMNFGYLTNSPEITYGFCTVDAPSIPNYGSAGSNFDITEKSMIRDFGTDRAKISIRKKIVTHQFSSAPVINLVTDDEIPSGVTLVLELTPPISNGVSGSFSNYKRLVFGSDAPFSSSIDSAAGGEAECCKFSGCPTGFTCVGESTVSCGYCVEVANKQAIFSKAFIDQFGNQPQSGTFGYQYYYIVDDTGQISQKKKDGKKKPKKKPKFKAGAELTKSVN